MYVYINICIYVCVYNMHYKYIYIYVYIHVHIYTIHTYKPCPTIYTFSRCDFRVTIALSRPTAAQHHDLPVECAWMTFSATMASKELVGHQD